MFSGKAVNPLSYSYLVNHKHAIDTRLLHVHWASGGLLADQCSLVRLSVGFHITIDKWQSCNWHLLNIRTLSVWRFGSRPMLTGKAVSWFPNSYFTNHNHAINTHPHNVHWASGGSLADRCFRVGMSVDFHITIDKSQTCNWHSNTWRTLSVWRDVSWPMLSGKVVSWFPNSYLINHNHSIDTHRIINVQKGYKGSSTYRCSLERHSMHSIQAIWPISTCIRHSPMQHTLSVWRFVNSLMLSGRAVNPKRESYTTLSKPIIVCIHRKHSMIFGKTNEGYCW